MIRILFICHGNICRSPMAEYILKDMLKKEGLEKDFSVESAATSREELGCDVYPPARRELARHGIPCPRRSARQVTRRDYGAYDLFVYMEKYNRARLLEQLGGDPEGKCRLLLSFTGRGGDIEDPWYYGRFDRCFDQIEEGCRAMLEQLARCGGM